MIPPARIHIRRRGEKWLEILPDHVIEAKLAGIITIAASMSTARVLRDLGANIPIPPSSP